MQCAILVLDVPCERKDLTCTYDAGGGRTASGERPDPNAMTVAHRSRPFGSHVKVTSNLTGRSVSQQLPVKTILLKNNSLAEVMFEQRTAE